MIEVNMPEWPGILLDAQLTVVQVNPAARCVLGANAHVLSVRQQCLHAPGDGPGLKRTLDRAALGGRAALLLARPGQLALNLRAERLPAQVGSWILVSLRDPELEVPDTTLLQSLFGLTSTEAQVAAALARGLDSAEQARAMGVQANTIQSHIKRVLAKTGARRQSQLVSLILRSVAMPPHPSLAGSSCLQVPGLAHTGSDTAAHSRPLFKSAATSTTLKPPTGDGHDQDGSTLINSEH